MNLTSAIETFLQQSHAAIDWASISILKSNQIIQTIAAQNKYKKKKNPRENPISPPFAHEIPSRNAFQLIAFSPLLSIKKTDPTYSDCKKFPKVSVYLFASQLLPPISPHVVRVLRTRPSSINISLRQSLEMFVVPLHRISFSNWKRNFSRENIFAKENQRHFEMFPPSPHIGCRISLSRIEKKGGEASTSIAEYFRCYADYSLWATENFVDRGRKWSSMVFFDDGAFLMNPHEKRWLDNNNRSFLKFFFSEYSSFSFILWNDGWKWAKKLKSHDMALLLNLVADSIRWLPKYWFSSTWRHWNGDRRKNLFDGFSFWADEHSIFLLFLTIFHFKKL